MAFRRCANDDPTLNGGLVALSFLGDPDQFCRETLYFCDFSVCVCVCGGGGVGMITLTLKIIYMPVRTLSKVCSNPPL